ncbi:MAG: thioesterase domain-containing protein [Opitutaceae bacterium]
MNISDDLTGSKQTEEVIEFVTNAIANELNKDAREIDPDSKLSLYGLESIFLLELIGNLAEWMEADIPESLIAEDASINMLADRLSDYVASYKTHKQAENKWQAVALSCGLHESELQTLWRTLSFDRTNQKNGTHLTVLANHTANSVPIFWSMTGTKQAVNVASLNTNRSNYLMPCGWSGIEHDERFVKALAKYYFEEIKQIAPTGVIEIGGFCRGCKVALEISRLLESHQLQVRKLYLIGSIGPHPKLHEIHQKLYRRKRILNRVLQKLRLQKLKLRNRRIPDESWDFNPEPTKTPTVVVVCYNDVFYAPYVPYNGWEHLLIGKRDLVVLEGKHLSALLEEKTRQSLHRIIEDSS